MKMWKSWGLVMAVLFAGCGGLAEQEPSQQETRAQTPPEQEENTPAEPSDEDIEAQWNTRYQLVYSENFGKGVAGPEWSIPRTAVAPNGTRRFLGPYNQTELGLHLKDLPEHDHIKLSFELFVIGTWDGNSPSCCGPDRWMAWVDGGPVLLDTTFSNDDAPFDPEFYQAYPGSYPGGSYPGLTGAKEKGTLGYPDESGYIGVGDSIYKLTFTFPHSGSTLDLRFADPPRPDANELWGLDCVRVKVGTTP